MNRDKRRALEKAGWRFGDAAEFLGMSDEERQLLDARVAAALAVRRQREALNLTQTELAARIKTSQPRIVKIEHAAPDVSLDQILRAFAAAGGRLSIKQSPGRELRKPGRVGGRKAPKRVAEPRIDLELDLSR